MNADVLEKLKILAESAKYDVSCSSVEPTDPIKRAGWAILWVDGAFVIASLKTGAVFLY